MMIEIVDLRFEYSDSDFEFNLPELRVGDGERVALVGPSGTGKTTLLNLIAGILPCQHGSLVVAGQRLHDMSDASRRAFRVSQLGLVFQDFELLEYLNTEENILLEYFIHRQLQLNSQVRQRAKELAESTGIGTHLRRSVQKLSHGERQRVAICRAMMTKPQVVLADEPTANLDFKNKQHIVELLIDHVEASGATLVVVTHDSEIVSRFDRTIEL